MTTIDSADRAMRDSLAEIDRLAAENQANAKLVQNLAQPSDAVVEAVRGGMDLHKPVALRYRPDMLAVVWGCTFCNIDAPSYDDALNHTARAALVAGVAAAQETE